MADELYTDNQVAPAPSKDEGSGNEESTPNTSVLPKEFFQGKELEPGSTCTISIKEVYDDSVEVEYVSSDETALPAEHSEVEMPIEESEMAAMME